MGRMLKKLPGKSGEHMGETEREKGRGCAAKAIETRDAHGHDGGGHGKSKLI
jgi:hypothetical protein